ncbi:MAG: hypothetical protein AAFY75_17325, partial [Pseudomonadota bacterium]
MTLRETPDPSETGAGFSGARAMLHVLWDLLRHEKWIIVALCISLVLTELGLRLFWPNLAGLVYAPDMTGGHKIILTEKAYRIPEGTEATRPPQILALGDSTTFGTGVGAEDTWPLQLNTHLAVPVVVRNAGVEGSEPRQMLRGLDTLWSDPTPPPVIVLMVTTNMVSFTEFRKDTAVGDPAARAKALRAQDRRPARSVKTRIAHIVQSSALWKAVSLNVEFGKYALGLLGHRVSVDAPLSPLLAYGWQQPDMPAAFGPQMWAEFESALWDLKTRTRSLGSCLIMGYLPPRFEIGDMRLDNLKFVPKARLTGDAEEELARIAAAFDLPFVSVGAALRQGRQDHGPLSRPYYIPGDYTHLDADGHSLAAQSLAQVIAPVLARPAS